MDVEAVQHFSSFSPAPAPITLTSLYHIWQALAITLFPVNYSFSLAIACGSVTLETAYKRRKLYG